MLRSNSFHYFGDPMYYRIAIYSAKCSRRLIFADFVGSNPT